MDWIERFAHVLVRYSLQIAAGDRLIIQADEAAAPLVREVYRLAIRAGAHVDAHLRPAGVEEIFFAEADEAQLATPSKADELIYQNYDAALRIMAPHNTRKLSGVAPAKLAARQRAYTEFMKVFMHRTASGEMRSCLTQFPSDAVAQEANMSTPAYRDFVVRAAKLDEDDPVAAWQALHDHQETLVARLNQVREMRYLAQDTDLAFATAGRTWENCDGKENFPDGEVFTAPLEDSVNGRIRFSFPGIYNGQAIEDIRLTFRDGAVVDAQAAEGEALLHALLDTDAGARRVGEIAIGTNYGIVQPVREMLFDEKIGGTVHLALGAGYPETGSQNESAIHWDMLCDMRQGGRILADGKEIYRDGRFL